MNKSYQWSLGFADVDARYKCSGSGGELAKRDEPDVFYPAQHRPGESAGVLDPEKQLGGPGWNDDLCGYQCR